MIRIDLNEDEAERLRALCEDELSDLRMEIAGTDLEDFRAELRKREAFLRRLLDRLAVLLPS
jgi:hypothetical protein